jgi:hypothetical protein
MKPIRGIRAALVFANSMFQQLVQSGISTEQAISKVVLPKYISRGKGLGKHQASKNKTATIKRQSRRNKNVLARKSKRKF